MLNEALINFSNNPSLKILWMGKYKLIFLLRKKMTKELPVTILLEELERINKLKFYVFELIIIISR